MQAKKPTIVTSKCFVRGDLYLVLAVTITSCWSSCHLDMFVYDTALPANYDLVKMENESDAEGRGF